ncbi:MAG TPA: hypothetical protein VFO86_11285 [Terriglobia bacterium]|nr:hypothetical protein [Terriglobia bacterium]
MNNDKPAGGTMDLFRVVALIAVSAGIVMSEILVIREGGRPQLLLTVAFVVWILLPFVAMAWAIYASKRWRPFARIGLYCTAILIVLGSVAFYARLILQRPNSPHAFPFVIGPLISWALVLIVVPTALAVSRKR